MVAILQLRSSSGNIKIRIGFAVEDCDKEGHQRWESYRRDIHRKIKRWRHSKKMNGFVIYTERLPYLQSSFLHLIQRENQGYRSYDTI